MDHIHFTKYSYFSATKIDTDGLDVALYAKTTSGALVGIVMRLEGGKGWSSKVGGQLYPSVKSPIFPTREKAKEWIGQEVERQQAVRKATPGNVKFHYFNITEGFWASTMIEILKIFEAHEATVGFFASKGGKKPAGAVLDHAVGVAMSYAAEAVTPELDKYGRRDCSYLSSNSDAVKAAAEAFPKFVEVAETVYLPIHYLSRLGKIDITINEYVSGTAKTLAEADAIGASFKM